MDTSVGPTSLQYGCFTLPKRARDFAEHPWGYYLAANEMARLLSLRISAFMPDLDVVVVEETNGARNRFTQKFLEYCHHAFLHTYVNDYGHLAKPLELVYLNTSEWRRVTETRLTKEDKNRNAKLSRYKRKFANAGKTLGYADKQAIGIAGKTTIKHVAIRRVKELYGVELLAKDDDPADAILLVHAYINGAKPCTGSEVR